MAIQRYFETTQLRLRSIFQKRLLDEDVCHNGAEFVRNYFKTLCPKYVPIVQIYDIIVGCLRFLHDDLKVDIFISQDPAGSIEFKENTCIFVLYPHQSDPMILTMQNFRTSMNPAISLKYKEDKIDNICAISFCQENFYIIYDILTSLIGEALFREYAKFEGGNVKWERL